MLLVRKKGLGALAWRGGSLAGGETGRVPVAVVEAYAHKLEVLEGVRAPEPVTLDPKPKPKAAPKAKPKAKGKGAG